jgi:hypothetical protein
MIPLSFDDGHRTKPSARRILVLATPSTEGIISLRNSAQGARVLQYKSAHHVVRDQVVCGAGAIASRRRRPVPGRLRPITLHARRDRQTARPEADWQTLQVLSERHHRAWYRRLIARKVDGSGDESAAMKWPTKLALSEPVGERGVPGRISPRVFRPSGQGKESATACSGCPERALGEERAGGQMYTDGDAGTQDGNRR